MRTTSIDQDRREKRDDSYGISSLLTQQMQGQFQSALAKFRDAHVASDSPLHQLLKANFTPVVPGYDLTMNPANLMTGLDGGIAIEGLRKSDMRLAEKQSLASFSIENGVISKGHGATKYNAIVQEASQTYGVPVALINAVIKQESAFNSEAVSPAGAQGLMQLMPATGQAYGCDNPFDARQNIMAGTRFLSDLLKMYKGDVELSLAGYNAGPGNVAKYGNQVPPFKETRNYVVNVQKYYQANLNETGRVTAKFAKAELHR